MNDTITNQDLFDAIETLNDNDVKIPALRAICNSSMAKCIGAIRQHIREEKRKEHKEAIDTSALPPALIEAARESNMSDLDQRNFDDENDRSVEEVNNGMGFTRPMSTLKLASLYHALFDRAFIDLKTLSDSNWDQPMTLDGMLEFMTTNAQPVDEAFVTALAEYLKCDAKYLMQMQEIMDKQDRQDLINNLNEIKHIFNGFGENGYNNILDDLPLTAHHQLGVKVVESMHKAKENLLKRILRSRRLSELGTLSSMDLAIEQLREWVLRFERQYIQELDEARDAGMNLRTLDDIKVKI